jgi:hypothetical protein
VQRDLVLRWIEQLGVLIRRLLHGKAAADLPAARDQVREATDALLGPLSPLVPRLEVESAAELLADPDRIFGYAQLLDLDSLIAGAVGDAAAQAEGRARALALAAEAVRRANEPRPSWESWISERG